MICTAHQMLYGWLYQEEKDKRAMWHIQETGEVHTGFWYGNLRKRGHLIDLGMDGSVILKWIYKK